MFASHNQGHMYGFSDAVSLLGSAPGIALCLQCNVIGTRSCETRVKLKELKDL